MKISDLKIKKGIKINTNDALLIVDIQNDFCPGGSLPVEGGEQIIQGVNKVADIFLKKGARIVLTQDWHPKNHLSFASNHEGMNPGDEYRSDDGAIGPVLWPDHCIQGSEGAKFHPKLETNLATAIIRKGIDPEKDSYSAFLENDKETETGLTGYLENLEIERIFICGLALDYCCYATAMDGMFLGFDTYFIVDLMKAIDLPPGNLEDCLINLEEEGVVFTNQTSFI